MIYLDHSATSFPKAPQVGVQLKQCLDEMPGNPGRGSHRWSMDAENKVDQVRSKISRYFHAPGSRNCIFHLNATDAINMALRGCLREGDHVITTTMSHNAISRPLYLLKNQGVIQTTILKVVAGKTDPQHLKNAINPNTRLLVLNHMSNVTGETEDFYQIKKILSAYPEVLLMVDAAQSAGHLDIDMLDMGIDILVFTGHKGLLGPMGTGGMLLSEKAAEQIAPHRVGGSGGDSSDPDQPRELPWRLEAGTPNVPGILGLGTAIDFIIETGTDSLHKKCLENGRLLYDGLLSLPGMRIFTDPLAPFIISFSHPIMRVAEWSALLDSEFGIASRSGLHCAPDMHRALGTFPEGLVRLSCGPFNTREEILAVIDSIKSLICI